VFDRKLSVAPPPQSGAVAPASTGSSSVLWLSEKAVRRRCAWQVEKKGVNMPHESDFIRFWDRDGGKYSFENSRGEEHLGTKHEAFVRFHRFQNDMAEAG
jgi:hypothetical protein